MKLTLAVIAGVAALGAAHAASAASVFETYNYTYYSANFDTANVGVTNTDTFAYTDVKVGGFDLGALAAGASTSVNVGDPDEGGLSSGLIAITSAHGNGSASFDFPDYDFATTQTLGAITLSGGVPEPSSWALMILGIGGLGFSLRNRRTAAVTTAA